MKRGQNKHSSPSCWELKGARSEGKEGAIVTDSLVFGRYFEASRMGFKRWVKAMKRFVFWSFGVRRLTFEHNMRREDRKLAAQGKARLVTVITPTSWRCCRKVKKNVKENLLRNRSGSVADGYGRMFQDDVSESFLYSWQNLKYPIKRIT